MKDSNIFECREDMSDFGFGFPSYDVVTSLTVMLSFYLMSFQSNYRDEPSDGNIEPLSPT